MPAIHFVAVIATGKTVSISLAFIANKNEQSYYQAVSTFRELVLGNAHIKVFLTDNEDALRSALSNIYPDVPQLLCLWHVNKNVLINVQKTWHIHPEFDANTNISRKAKREEFMKD